eukprot:TRINITY_DN19448_c0_g1_i3.p1 TRINITY_DN19448_c0_g1~~TRINITY_DN19448_c0_g1_i3.p1  ORF type:complete len:426 (-),score=50.52 TRINITY_DN19448_c0_g1_i3:292-1569(-)
MELGQFGSRVSIRKEMSFVVFLVILFLMHAGDTEGACSKGQCQVHEICSTDSDCAEGLKCSSCSSVGDMNYRCTKVSLTDPFSKVGRELPFNKYSWLTTHNSFAILGEKSYTGGSRLTFSNQEDSITDQLKSGVRGLMLDMYDYNNDIWLCHSFGGKCYNFTAFSPAINTLQAIKSFMDSNPTAIITIFIEDYVESQNGLTNVFTKAGLMKYWFPLSEMPKNGSDWPLVSYMLSKNYRLLVFTSKKAKEQSEKIAYEWNYVIENQYGDAGLQTNSCSNRAESNPLTAKAQTLFLENFFPDNPSIPKACVNNSSPLLSVLNTCRNASGRWANFLAVDFYKRSYGGGAFQAVDKLNGESICGCSDINQCMANATYGVCNTTNSFSSSATDTDSSVETTSERSTSEATLKNRPLVLVWLLLLFICFVG